MTRIAVIGDVHARFAYLDRVLSHVARQPVDAVLFVGDLGSHHLALARKRSAKKDALYRISVARVLEAARQLGVPVRYVPGNHDLPDLELPGNLDHRVDTVAGLRIGGIGGAGPARFGFCYEWSEDEIRARPPLVCDILLAHCPPRNTPLDRVPHRAEHVGSEAIRERAEQHVGVLVCGHIHESPGFCWLGDCLCFNVGGLGEPFGVAQVGYVDFDGETWTGEHVDLDSGAVTRSPPATARRTRGQRV